MSHKRGQKTPPRLDLARTFDGARLVVIGGTGFLGKVWWVLLLHHFPNIGQLHMVVRSRPGQTAHERFWDDIATGECLEPLREQHADGFKAFLESKVSVLDGDITKPYCGIGVAERGALGKVDAIVNASGIVDFQPPLDIALEVNAFGVQNLVQLARDLGDTPILHTSTCYVAGYRTGIVEEQNPLDHPFPYAGQLERVHWDPDREIEECLNIIAQAKQRANDAFRQSHFLDQAKRNLIEANEPARGAVLDAEIERVRRKFVEQQLAGFGQERAHFWGWPNTYTYTKSIGEQIAARSGLRFTIVRPAIVESCVKFPLVGWNEGVNTSAPLIFAIREGQQQFPGANIRLDIIPCDMVASGITLALGELLDGSQQPVYQFGTSDSNPTTMTRIYELSGLYKRKYYQRTGKGGPLIAFAQQHLEGSLLSAERFESIGPRAMSKGASVLADVLEKTPKGPIGTMITPTVRSLRKFSRTQSKIADIIGQFMPFTAELDYEFRCDATRAANARLSEEERTSLYWSPESLDWRDWFLNVHAPGLERWVFPVLEKRLRKPERARRRHETLTAMLEELAQRHDLAVALQRVETEGLSRCSFREFHERALACAARLQSLGVNAGDAVAICAKNHPDWAIAFFGILFAGGTAVPLDANVDATTAQTLLRACNAKALLLDDAGKARLSALLKNTPWLLLGEAATPGASGFLVSPRDDDTAVLAYTSGTTGTPKGVMLTHRNLTNLIASLAPLFPLGKDDRVLSVLPLHQSFELTCGMLLPLSSGCRVVYLDELNAERLEHALNAGRITALIGVPALWELLERRILTRVKERGALASQAFSLALEWNRVLNRNLGIDASRLLFGSVHRALGGNLKYLVSGGAALGETTHQLFAGLGLHLAESYGLAEAGPVLSVSRAGPRSRPGQVGTPIPNVEIRIDNPDEHGVGEVLARGPNVMRGYLQNEAATRAALTEDGWLRTGDLGKLDHRGRLSITPRDKDTQPQKDTRPQKSLQRDVTEPSASEFTASEFTVPEPLRRVGKAWLGQAQANFYDRVLQVRVTGRAFIPKNRNLLVVANHASHLDMGLVKHALGEYGSSLVALAARDSFFEGRFKKAFFENFSDRVPVSRGDSTQEDSLQESLSTAKHLLQQGHVVLIFPEGTRSPDGALRDFKPLVGSLALQAGVDVLPMWLGGTFEALPKGATLIRNRKLRVRIGPPLTVAALRAHTHGVSPVEAAHKVAMFAQHAISELAQGRVFELPEVATASVEEAAMPKPTGLAPVFEELKKRWHEGAVSQPLSYYFSLGEERWTLKLSRDACQIDTGRTVDAVDCVLKTTPEMFRRIVLDGYTPSASEFMSGAIKSNNIPVLLQFQKAFKL